MADIDTSNGHPAMDYEEHVHTYSLFLNLSKFGLIGCIAVLVGMAIFLL